MTKFKKLKGQKLPLKSSQTIKPGVILLTWREIIKSLLFSIRLSKRWQVLVPSLSYKSLNKTIKIIATTRLNTNLNFNHFNKLSLEVSFRFQCKNNIEKQILVKIIVTYRVYFLWSLHDYLSRLHRLIYS